MTAVGECIVAACSRPATVAMSLVSFGEKREARFCEACASRFEGCWVRDDPVGQLELAPITRLSSGD